MNTGYPWDWQISSVPRKSNQHKVGLEETTRLTSWNVTSTVGTTAVLPCETSLLDGYTVSWLRKKDTTVLSVGVLTFSSDRRISVISNDGGKQEKSTWNLQVCSRVKYSYLMLINRPILQIRKVSDTDEGWYECQVNTEPKLSHKTFLRVKPLKANVPRDSPQLPQVIPQIQEYLKSASVSKIRISGPSQLQKHVDESLELLCTLDQIQTDRSSRLYWTFNQRPIDVALSVSIRNRNSYANSSQLVVEQLERKHEGVFACQSDDRKIEAASVQVHIIDDNKEHPMALPQKKERDGGISSDGLEARLSSIEARLAIIEAKLNYSGEYHRLIVNSD